ncbi:MAG: hypothetical protein R3F02_14980 [Thiolinea sp.]
MAVSLTGCSDDDDNSGSSAKVIASLVTPSISNLAYQGSQGSAGRTSAAGEYQCESGETVTFSLGTSAIGSVNCTEGSKTSLMQLAGGGLTVETALDEMQRADGTTEVLSYDQWMNRLSLLGELDSNADLSDGAQLPDGLDEVGYLQTGKLNFNQAHSLFGTQIKQVFQQAALAGLYQRPLRGRSQGSLIKELEVESLGALAFPGYVLDTSLIVTGNDSDEFTATYNDLGEWTQSTYNLNDVLTRTTTASHDDAGRVVQEVDEAADGSKTEHSIVWDNQNRITSQTITQYDADGNKLAERVRSDIYSSDGFLSVRSESQHDLSAQTLNESETFLTYNTLGQLESVDTANSVTVNGVPDGNQATNSVLTNSYDEKGNLVNSILDQTDNNSVLFSRTVLNHTFDEYGRVIARDYQEQDANGNVLSNNTTLNTYTEDGYLRKIERLYQTNGQGAGAYEETYAYAGTPKRRLNGIVRKYYNPEYANGDDPLRVYSLAYQYNDAGLRTQVTEKTFEYQDGEGNALANPNITTSTQSWFYDENNNPTLISTDNDGDGEIDKTEGLNWNRLERFGGWYEINSKARTFTQYDEEFKVSNASESGWEAALVLTPPAQGSINIVSSCNDVYRSKGMQAFLECLNSPPAL